MTQVVGLVVVIFLSALAARASPVQQDVAALQPRANPSCTSPVLRGLNRALTAIGPPASSFCSSFLDASIITETGPYT